MPNIRSKTSVFKFAVSMLLAALLFGELFSGSLACAEVKPKVKPSKKTPANPTTKKVSVKKKPATTKGKPKTEKPKTAKKGKAHKVTYTEHILPIFRQHCGSCHNANDQKGGLTLDDYAAMMQGGGSGEVIDTTDVDSSYLVMTITRESEPYMPPNGKMPAKDIKMIKEWIKLGAPKNSGSKIVKKENKVTKVEISLGRPAGPPTLPETVSIEPIHFSKRANTVTAMAASPWAPLIAYAGHKQVFLYDTQNLAISGVLPFPEGTIHALKFSRNGRLLMCGGGRGGASGKVALFDVKTGKRIATIGAEYDSVLAADVSPDQTKVVLAGPKRMIRVFDVKSGELLYEIKKHTDWVTAAAFSPDGVLLATGDRSNGLVLWEASTGREFVILNGHRAGITAISWRPDSNQVASASKDGTIKLWELNNGNVVKSWSAHGGGVTAMSFARDGRIISAGRADRRTKMWAINGKALRAFPVLPAIPTAVCLNVESDYSVAGDWAGAISVWSNKSGKLVTTLKTNPNNTKERIHLLKTAASAKAVAEKKAVEKMAGINRSIAQRKKIVVDLQNQIKKTRADNVKTKVAINMAKNKWDQENKNLATAQRNLKKDTSQLQALQKKEQARVAQFKAALAKIKKEDKKAIQKITTTNTANEKKFKAGIASQQKRVGQSKEAVTTITASLAAIKKSSDALQKQTKTQTPLMKKLEKDLRNAKKRVDETRKWQKEINRVKGIIAEAKHNNVQAQKQLSFVLKRQDVLNKLQTASRKK